MKCQKAWILNKQSTGEIVPWCWNHWLAAVTSPLANTLYRNDVISKTIPNQLSQTSILTNWFASLSNHEICKLLLVRHVGVGVL